MELYLLMRLKKSESLVWLLIKENILQEIFIQRKLKIFKFMNMVHIYFIPAIRRFGIM